MRLWGPIANAIGYLFELTIRSVSMSAPVRLQILLGFLMFALVFVPLERCFPRRKLPLFRPGWITDVTYYVVGCGVGRFTDVTSLTTMWLVLRATGLNGKHIVAVQPGWLQFLEILITADFLSYVYHRALHRYGWLWRLHRVHHTSQRMDWLANVRLHPVDKIMGDCFQFIPIFCLGFSTGPLLAYQLFLGFQGFLNHSNIKVHFGPLRWVIAGPQFHHWHHSDDPKVYNKNFAPHLVVFDLLFGTAYLPADRSTPENYGIRESMPRGFWRQTISPLR